MEENKNIEKEEINGVSEEKLTDKIKKPSCINPPILIAIFAVVLIFVAGGFYVIDLKNGFEREKAILKETSVLDCTEDAKIKELEDEMRKLIEEKTVLNRKLSILNRNNELLVINQTEERVVDGITKPRNLSFDDFVKIYSSISNENKTFLKELMYSSTDAWGFTTSYIQYIEDTSDKNIIYFIDERYNSETYTQNSNIYSINLSTNKIKEIYHFSSETERFKLLGIKKDKLLLFKQITDTSPGPCYNEWIDAYENPLPRINNDSRYYANDAITVKSLNLNDTASELSSFVITKEIYMNELEVQEKCKEEFNKKNSN